MTTEAEAGVGPGQKHAGNKEMDGTAGNKGVDRSAENMEAGQSAVDMKVSHPAERSTSTLSAG
ncbi:hypothetical protein [Nocardia terpenica]|uniref:hypothetical protein n=1 Tax=Nocardia terpenica TaxID=455432 RepID=UPI000B2C7325|nr:hypothetical protein [Nocardia terpenica]